jgi:hypothetical protein
VICVERRGRAELANAWSQGSPLDPFDTTRHRGHTSNLMQQWGRRMPDVRSGGPAFSQPTRRWPRRFPPPWTNEVCCNTFAAPELQKR